MNTAEIASTVITAYEMADPTMKRISREMALIVLDPETDKDDQEIAFNTLMDALGLFDGETLTQIEG
jgi:predicted Zn-dependent protease with MMP-like domain